MRPNHATARKVQRARLDWYEFHFNNRMIIKALDPATLEVYRYAAGLLQQQPQMTVYGGLPHDYPCMEDYQLAARYGLDINLVNPWYLSDEGWQAFQTLWQQLPEPVDSFTTPPCVQIGNLSTLSTIGAEAAPPK